ncbi:MAG: ABC transporter substrate-binding protein [Desulfomonilaceae bacterium]
MKHTGAIFALVIVFLVLPHAVLSADVPGVTDTEVVVGISTPLSGPAALWGAVAMGSKAWADYVNQNGGVHGRMIKVLVKDDAYNPTRTVTNYAEMKGKVFVTMGQIGSACCSAVRDLFPENNFLGIQTMCNVRIWADQTPDKRKWVFALYPDYVDEGEFMGKYSMEKLGSKKFGIFYQNDDYGKMGLSGLNQAIAGKAALVADVPHEVGDTGMGPHALKLKESGADTVILYTNPKHAALISKEMVKVGYTPKRVACFPLADKTMFEIAKSAWDGTYVSLSANSGIPGSEPQSDRVVDIIVKQNPEIKGKEWHAILGAINMMHFAEGLKRAGRDLTIDSFTKGMESIKDWKPEGIGAVVEYGPNRHHGVNGFRMAQAKDGKIVPLETEYHLAKPRF